MQVREVKRKDYSKITELEQKVLYPELSIEELEQWEEGKGRFKSKIFVVEKNGTVVGLAVYEIYEINGSEIVLTLDALVIDENCQGQGFGRKLLIESFQKAIEFYEGEDRFKFRVVGLLIQTDLEPAGFYEKVFSVEKFQRKDFSKVWSSGEPLVIFFISI